MPVGYITVNKDFVFLEKISDVYSIGHWKNEDVLRYEDFVDILSGHYKTGLILGVISMHFRPFLRSWYRMGIFFFFFGGGGGGVLKIQIFFGLCLIFQIYIFFW